MSETNPYEAPKTLEPDEGLMARRSLLVGVIEPMILIMALAAIAAFVTSLLLGGV